MLARKHWMWGAAATLAAAAVWLVQAADVETGHDFQPDEAVKTIRVEITVGAGGGDLNEPIALDLGLGFPLWLHAVGRESGQQVPFGAVPQKGATVRTVRAGERAVFEFDVSGTAGQDLLRTTPQLLAGVHVSDISRVGFTSKGEGSWVLAGYKVSINDKLLASNDAADAKVETLQEAARQRLTELSGELAPRQQELADLEALVAANLATDADRTRLAELKTTLAPQLAEQRRIERQLEGAAPFFAESEFKPAWRTNGAIEKVKVTVVTAPHTGAETRNYVYFRTGGHKYLLGSPVNPLSPDFGAQEFELDLATAPLAAGDLRGYALGMLAHHEPYGDAPDRWHPQRLRVEVDGRVVYDSEENTIDRTSLSAIRLIPPAHEKSDGSVKENTPVAREAFVWEAGSGAGLDLINGGAEELPPADDPAHPEAEPGLVVDQDVTVVDQDETWYDPDAGPFPGETGFGPEWMPGLDPWGPGFDPGFDPGWGPGWDPGPSWFDLLVLGLLDELGLLPDWVVPDPVGEPPQLEEVRIDYGTSTVEWTVTGDESQIDHFVVDRLLIRPDLDAPLVHTLSDLVTVSADQRSLHMSSLPVTHPFMGTVDEESRSYTTVRVTMVPTDPAVGVDPGFAPAAPIRPTSHPGQFNVAPLAGYVPPGGPPQVLTVAMGGEPELPGPAVWLAGQSDSHNALVFGGLSPAQHHVVARAVNTGDHFAIHLNGHANGRFRFIGFLAFRGALEVPAAVDVSSNCFVVDPVTAANHNYVPPDVHLDSDPNLSPTALRPLIIDIDTAADVAPGNMEFYLHYYLHCTNLDPNHPPMLLGLRMIEMP